MVHNKELRPSFHITGGAGWINDPNGLIYFKGKYHAFYQHYPHATCWGPMHWGHVVSDDLIHWERLPIALYPVEYSKEDGCFSGTAIIHNDTLYLVYTGFYENGGGENIRQLQCLASSKDGINFEKHGIIIGEDILPEKYSACDFRDPKVWMENDTFYMIVAAKIKEGKGQIIMFKSPDLFNWEFVGEVLPEESKGIMIECPDYVKELGLLMYSEQFQPNEGYTHLNVHSCRYETGNIDVETAKFNSKSKGIVDYGFDFYAPQSFSNKNLIIAWLNMWDRNNPSEKYGFAGTLTVPREIKVINGVLLQKPVWNYEGSKEIIVESTYKDNFKIGAIKLEISDLNALEISLRKLNKNEFKINLINDLIVFDRSNAGEQIMGIEKDEDSLNGIRRMPLINRENVEIEIISDEFSLEIFVNGLSASFLIYPDVNATGFEINVDCSKCKLTKSEYK